MPRVARTQTEAAADVAEAPVAAEVEVKTEPKKESPKNEPWSFNGTKFLEVEILRPYAPFGFVTEDDDGNITGYMLQSDPDSGCWLDGTIINKKVLPAEKGDPPVTLKVPADEASRMLRNSETQIARMTENTFKHV